MSKPSVMLYCYNIVFPCRSLKAETKRQLDIQGVSGGIVNILGGGSMDYSE
jgi:hypothetical protein